MNISNIAIVLQSRMDKENNKVIQKIMSLVPSKRRLKTQCIPTRSEAEVKKELEEFVKTYDPVMDSIKYHLTHAPSKGILKRSSYSHKLGKPCSPSEPKGEEAVAAIDIAQPEDPTDEEEAPILFPTIKDSLEILLKKKSSISARKSILKNPSRTSNQASSVDIQQTSDDDEMTLVTKFPAKDSMEILIKKTLSKEGTFDKGDENKIDADITHSSKDNVKLKK